MLAEQVAADLAAQHQVCVVLISQDVACGKYALSARLKVDGYKSTLDIEVRTQPSQALLLHRRFQEGEIAELLGDKPAADPGGWIEAPFGAVEVREAGRVHVRMSSIEDPWWKGGLAWDGLRLRRVA